MLIFVVNMSRFLICLCVLLSGLLSVPPSASGVLQTMESVRKVDGNPYLYTMDYHVPYDLDDMVSKDVDEYVELLNYAVARILNVDHVNIAVPELGEAKGVQDVFNCTSFQVLNENGCGYRFGRNYDYYKNPTLVTRTFPQKGYASIAVCDMSFIGYSLDHVPKTIIQRLNCLVAVYAPLDGMNEKGFCGSILALPSRFSSQQDTPNHDIGTSAVLRLMLDRCATVEEAIALLESLDVRQDPMVKSGFHYMIADAGGNCAVIEFDPEDKWKTLIVRKPADRSYMQVTNHMLAPKYYSPEPDKEFGNTGSQSWTRYDRVGNYIEERGGTLSQEEAFECLAQVRWVDLKVNDGLAAGTQYQIKFRGMKAVVEKLPERGAEDTQYSCVYDQQNLVLSLRNWNDYDTTHTFSLLY